MSTNLAQHIATLGETFPGEVITPGDARYDHARRVWNGMIDRHPAAVLRPTTPEAVATALRFGRDNDVTIAVRSGGHSAAGLSTCDDGIVIDLSEMRGVFVDPEAQTARVQGGATRPRGRHAQMAGRSWPSSTSLRWRMTSSARLGWSDTPASPGSPWVAGWVGYRGCSA